MVDYSTLFLRRFKLHFQTVHTDVLFSIFLTCSKLSDSGEDAKVRGTRKVQWRGGKKLSPVSSPFIFVFALSQFRGPDYLGAWNRL